MADLNFSFAVGEIVNYLFPQNIQYVSGYGVPGLGFPPLENPNAVGVISAIQGTPTQAGTYDSTWTDWTLGGSGVFTTVEIVVTAAPPSPPVVAPAAAGQYAYNFYVGQPLNIAVGATNSPTSWTASGLPPGTTINSSGMISGTPTTPGLFLAAVQATNAGGTGAPVYISITILAAEDAPEGQQYLDAEGVDLFLDIQSRAVSFTAPADAASSTSSGATTTAAAAPTTASNATLLVKRLDTVLLLVRFVKGTAPMSMSDMTSLTLTLRPQGAPNDPPLAEVTLTGSGLTAATQVIDGITSFVLALAITSENYPLKAEMSAPANFDADIQWQTSSSSQTSATFTVTVAPSITHVEW